MDQARAMSDTGPREGLNSMEKIKVYDLPTRIFHWLFAALFIAAFFIAKTIDDDSPVYSYHMLLGLTLAFSVILRAIWGFFGSRYARFSSFVLNPVDLVSYAKNLLTSKTQRYLGHNPASSWAALVMMGLSLGLATTGYFMAQDVNKEFFEEIHELFANTFIIVAIAHVAGIIFHTIRHREIIGLSMLHGKKDPVEGQPGMQKSHFGTAVLFVALIGTFVFYLNKNYNTATQELNFFGKILTLGENENADTQDGDDD